ncbi:hypothetical protein F5B21DRAFT_497369 [Xylaria acuta]|nr:hypothetical protein F5B21DRAFT_497369 [Xylaria acuta]
MDPLSMTASVLAVATLALQSSKAAYDFVNGLTEAPVAVARSKTSLMETQKTLGALQQMLAMSSQPPILIGAISEAIELGVSVKEPCPWC